MEKKLKDGVDVSKLKPGTKIKVQTINSIYDFEVTKEPGYLLAKGGKYLLIKQKVKLSGSYDNSILRIGWIGIGMPMEILIDKEYLNTSYVKEISIKGNDWEYLFN